MRGRRLFDEIITEQRPAREKRKGRSSTLISRRDECLVARYFYYGYLKHKSYDDILKLLVSEFFLSPATISRQVQQRSDELHELKQKASSAFYFQHRWPHLKW